MRSTKENCIEDRCHAMEKGMKAGNSKVAYDTQHDLTKICQQRAAVIDDKDSKLITDNDGVLRR